MVLSSVMAVSRSSTIPLVRAFIHKSWYLQALCFLLLSGKVSFVAVKGPIHPARAECVVAWGAVLQASPCQPGATMPGMLRGAAQNANSAFCCTASIPALWTEQNSSAGLRVSVNKKRICELGQELWLRSVLAVLVREGRGCMAMRVYFQE